MIPRFIEQEDATMATKYDAGHVDIIDDNYIIAYETRGAYETFSIGQPVYDEDGNLMGYMGIGLYNHLNFSRDLREIRIPCEYWSICLPTPFCTVGKKVYTYWQNKERGKE